VSAPHDGLDEVVREFLVESAENLDQLDADLVSLEGTVGPNAGIAAAAGAAPPSGSTEPGPPRDLQRALLASIFRTIHTIKGTSGFLAFGRLEQVTHVGETLLAKLRDGRLPLTPDAVAGLLDMVDAVRDLLAGIEDNGVEPVLDQTELIADLSDLAGVAPPPLTTPDPAPDGPAAPATALPPVAGQPAEGAAGSVVLPPAAALPGFGSPSPAVPAVGRPGVPDEGLPVDEEALPAATMIGQVLVAASSVSPEDVHDAVLRQLAGDTRPLGEILATTGAVSKRAVAAALQVQQRTKARRAVNDASVRVDVQLLDDLMRLVGELVLARNQLLQEITPAQQPAVDRATQRLSHITSELQESVMKTRMQTVDALWAKLPRVVRDLALQCGKQVRLELEGGDTEVDRTLLDAVKDPLTHLVRNAVDHGIEGPVLRRASGKSDTGTLRLRAYHAGGQVVIDIIDDGKGIDPLTIARTALEKGLVTAEQLSRATPEEMTDLIFLPGFSTADAVTNVSGRGVGMDVVRTNIEECGGRVQVNSLVGQGTTIRVTLPLTLAIMPALLVDTGGHLLAVPQSHLLEVVRLTGRTEGPVAGPSDDTGPDAVEYVAGAPVHRLRGELLPLVFLRDVLGLPAADPAATSALLVLHVESCRFGLVVDSVRETQEIVVKPLGQQLRELRIYAGATILGDASTALILDIGSVARSARLVVGKRPLGSPSDAAIPPASRTELLVVEIGRGRLAAIPVADVTRLETLPVSAVELADGREVVQYRGGLLPLLPLGRMLGAGSVPAWEDGSDAERMLHLLVWERGPHRVGLVVEAIRDVTKVELGDALARPARGGVIDSIVIQDRVTDLLDIAQLLSSWSGWGAAS
jgi:two-component system chemotaxis sensor kinase CheA